MRVSIQRLGCGLASPAGQAVMASRSFNTERTLVLQTLTESQRAFLAEAVQTYQEIFPGSPAEEYIAGRGIDLGLAQSTFRLGYVRDPLPSHELYRGMLCIPYQAKSGPVGVKFRRLDDATPRYLAPENSRVRLYNVLDTLTSADQILIVEGEIDCMTAKSAGVPAVVGVSGAQNWKSHFAKVLEGYEEVLICVDNDINRESGNPGQQLAAKILRDIPHARNVIVSSGLDLNALYLQQGREGLLQTLGVKVETQEPTLE